MTHIQDNRSIWESASDEQHLQGLLNRGKAIINPTWMNYLKRNRPHLIGQYLNLYQQGGGYLGKPARDYLKRHN